jgi:glycogen phosphorylase
VTSESCEPLKRLAYNLGWAPRVAYFSVGSDLDLPVVGVGLLYRYGDRVHPGTIPLRPVFAAEGVPLEIGVPFPGRTVVARVWLAQVGRVRLYLLDTDLLRNREDDRWITAHVHGGDRDTRLRQDVVVGIGGARLIQTLQLLGLEVAPEVYHLSEAHSAFIAIERAAQRMRSGTAGDFFTAHQHVAASVTFTMRTPVEAGHDTFPAELIDAYLGEYREGLGLSHEQFMSLGRLDPGAQQEEFSMTVLALRSARARRGVSDRTFVSGRPC